MKKLFMFLMAAFLLLGIAACNGDPTTADTTTAPPTTETPGVTTETPTTADPYADWDRPSGLYNYKFATSELRHTFMAAAEKYLMNTMYGGVPLFANGGFVMYSSRLQLPVESYIPVMGYGTSFGTMTEDDSKVIMADGSPGNVGEYTFRTTSTTNPGTFNQWLYDTSTDSDYMGFFYDAPYTYQFNADKDGYEVNASMMKGVPTPIDSETTDTGKVVSTKWKFEVKDGLKWFYHPQTLLDHETKLIAENADHEELDATDFVETYKTALKLGWFRAISGGGDFLNDATGIKGAAAYTDDPTEANWDNVGIKLDAANNSFTFEFMNKQSEWNVRYFMSSFVMTPVNLELLEVLGNPDDGGTFGIDNESVAYHGPYYVSSYEPDKTVRYLKNPNYHSPTEYFYTGYDWQIINDSAVRFQEFAAGKLESVSLPTENYDDYKNDPRLRRVPGATTFRMMINGLGTAEEQQKQFPGSSYVPEPLLATHNFKMAMFHAIDRQYLAETVLKTSQTQMYLFSDAYLVEAEEGIPYRETAQGQTVGEGLAPGSNGYNKEAAIAYYELAVEELIASGTYKSGDTIEMDFFIFSGSEAQTLLGAYIKDTFEDTFKYAEENINVKVNVVPKDFPGIYYDFMMTGNFDLSIGGISGSTLDAASFLDVFTDDDRGGFTLNWGIDTSTANIPVTYNFYDKAEDKTVEKREVWSFNALVAVLNGQKYLLNGEEAEVPNPIVGTITPTSFEFEIDQFNNTEYKDITYTIQEFNQEDEKYVDLTGKVDVTPTSANVTITGVKPYPYDYQIIVKYTLVETGDKLSESTWFYSGKLISKKTITNGTDQAVIELTYNTDDLATRAIKSVVVYDFLENDVTADITVDTVGNKVTLTKLKAGAEYNVVITSTDEFTDKYVAASNYNFTVNTKSIVKASDEVKMTNTTADFSVVLNEVAIEEVKVYELDGTDITATALKSHLRNNISLEKLSPNTKYIITVKSVEDADAKVYYEDVVFTTNSLFTTKDVTLVKDKEQSEADVVLSVGSHILKKIIVTQGDVTVKEFDLSTVAFDVNGLNFKLDGLQPATKYKIMVETKAGLKETFTFTTESMFVEKTVEAEDKTAKVTISVGDYTIDSIKVELVEVDANKVETVTLQEDVVIGASVEGEIEFNLAGLTAEKTYRITVETDGGLIESFTFKTTATPAA